MQRLDQVLTAQQGASFGVVVTGHSHRVLFGTICPNKKRLRQADACAPVSSWLQGKVQGHHGLVGLNVDTTQGRIIPYDTGTTTVQMAVGLRAVTL